MKAYHKSQHSGLIINALLFCSTLFAQTYSSVFTDNKLKSKLDTAIDKSKIYLQDNMNGYPLVFISKQRIIHTITKGKLANFESFYNIGSVAKTFVATILAGVIDKKLNLDDYIRKFLPTISEFAV
jgi:hypothetical protein